MQQHHRLMVCAVLTLLALASWLCPRAEAQLEFVNQDSPNTFYHSGICVNGGVVWDTSFADIVAKAIQPNNYNEVGFGFMECFGGGMIDELLAKNLVNASYTSAARWDQSSWAADPRGGFGRFGPVESTYNRPYAPVEGGAGNTSLRAAAIAGRNGDVRGPVVGNPALENPQYTADRVGDSITLHRNNPNNPNNNTKYLAVLFGGSTRDQINLRTLTREYNALIARGYAANEIYTLYTGGKVAGAPWINSNTRARDLIAAWNWVKNNSNATTQVYYWNSWGHGTISFDAEGYFKKNGVRIRNRIPARFNPGAGFAGGVDAEFAYYSTHSTTSPLDDPYLDIQTDQPVDGLGVSLNGDALTQIGPADDVFGDGSRFDYRFALNGTDIQHFTASNDSVQINWNGADPSFEMIDVNQGDGANGLAVVTPERESVILWVVGGLGLAPTFLRRRRSTAPVAVPRISAVIRSATRR